MDSRGIVGSMRPFAWFLLGALAGIVGTVMVYTLDPLFQGDEGETSGGGNVRLVLDPTAVSALAERVGSAMLSPLADYPSVVARSTVRTSGVVDLTLELRSHGETFASGSVTFDPEIDDGTLAFVVVRDELPGIVDSSALGEGMARELVAWLSDLAMGRAYRVVAIATADGRLAVEIAFTN